MKALRNFKKKLRETKQKQNVFLGFSQSSHDYEQQIRIRLNRYAY
ncbi:hypothetical protein [Aquimarina mytili]|nr:hypothetical protein [Aquimarina mytili]